MPAINELNEADASYMDVDSAPEAAQTVAEEEEYGFGPAAVSGQPPRETHF